MLTAAAEHEQVGKAAHHLVRVGLRVRVMVRVRVGKAAHHLVRVRPRVRVRVMVRVGKTTHAWDTWGCRLGTCGCRLGIWVAG